MVGMHFKKKNKLLFFLIILLLILVFFVINMERPSTKSALKQMQKSPYYDKLHKISKEKDNKLSEIFLEKGNYAWGGYEAILLIETKNETKLYSYFLHQEGFRFCENIINKKDFNKLFDRLTEKGLWEISNRFYNPIVDPKVDDGSTYFLKIIKGTKEKSVIVYAPELIEGAKIHWDIIKDIKGFYRKYYCEEMKEIGSDLRN